MAETRCHIISLSYDEEKLKENLWLFAYSSEILVPLEIMKSPAQQFNRHLHARLGNAGKKANKNVFTQQKKAERKKSLRKVFFIVDNGKVW